MRRAGPTREGPLCAMRDSAAKRAYVTLHVAKAREWAPATRIETATPG